MFDPGGHAEEEAFGEERVGVEEVAEGLGGEECEGGGFEGVGEGGAGEVADGGDFAEGVGGADEVEYVFFARGGGFVDAYEAVGDDEDAGAGGALAEEEGIGGGMEEACGLDEGEEGGLGDGFEHGAGGEDFEGGEGRGWGSKLGHGVSSGKTLQGLM